mmetsp:Transcript_45553/g.52654  ORF Transcript_45553/g.52654 Transcript_45553/m.52654 type:complete len:108 (+) Transcript_45553:40-363(+)
MALETNQDITRLPGYKAQRRHNIVWTVFLLVVFPTVAYFALMEYSVKWGFATEANKRWYAIIGAVVSLILIQIHFICGKKMLQQDFKLGNGNESSEANENILTDEGY